MRIITGTAKGTKLFTLDGLNTRPTSERAKEGIFSILQFEIEGRSFLDLFSGSGQMGLEALSRGAKEAVLVDRAKDAAEIIRKNAVKSHLSENCEVVIDDSLSYLKKCSGRKKFDIIFIDPPYAGTLVNDSVMLIREGGLVKPTSYIVCESDREDVIDTKNLSGFEIIKKVKYGVAHILVLHPTEEI